ncbi:3-hydroxyacyl-thioester dehydratase X-like [Liolophura sinensis]|uniref:3-hydroxyacyl-thioester dehydratase X-like n=1 Tax=Liolophura sinensis TaxID=3198878 RepID=UPI0031597BAC
MIYVEIIVMIVGAFLAFFFALWYSSCFEDFKDSYTYNDKPSLLCIFTKGLILSLKRKQGRLYREGGKFGLRLSSVGSKDSTANSVSSTGIRPKRANIVFKDCRLNPAKLQEYRKVCGDTESVSVPLMYMECLFTRPLITLAVSSKSQLAPLGLIHIKQTVTIYENLDDLLTLPFDLDTEVMRYREVDRGVEADIRLQVFNMAEKCVWEGETTLLSRNPKAQRSGGHRTAPVKPEQGGFNEVELSVPGDTGIRYAKATGDWNPHHLYSWSAKLLGYRQPIAHGMWTLAKALAVIQNSGGTLTLPVHVDASFKRPLFMPGVCLVQCGVTSPAVRWLRVVDKVTGAPHLIATVTLLKT